MAELIVWTVANAVSSFYSGRDLRRTWRLWRWTKGNGSQWDVNVTFRSFRLAAIRFGIAVAYLGAALFAIANLGSSIIVWLLVIGSVLLAVDAVLEGEYRKRHLYSAKIETQRKKDIENA